jgi:hypothetical protein
MRVRRQTAIGEVDSPAIEELAAGRDSDEHRRVTVLGNADDRGSPPSLSRHVFLLLGARRVTARISGALPTFVKWHTWTPRFAKRSFECGVTGRECSHTSGLLA